MMPLRLSGLAIMAVFALLAGPVSAAAKTAEEFVGPPSGQPIPNDSAQKPPAKGGAKAAAPAKAGATAAKPLPAKPAANRPALDTAKLHATYLDGDFEQAIRTMEAALKSKKPLSHGDSVFIFKHLGVMYAATPATREKGRYYMAQLIYVEPTAKILDMYASDMIYLIFRNVQEEFEHKYPQVAKPAPVVVDTVPKPVAAPAPAPAPAPVARQSSKSKTLYWVTGGAVVAAGTAGLLFVLLDNPKPKKHNIVFPE
jgi:hypothetical protein